MPRCATAVESLLELTTNRSSRPWSAFSSRVKAAARFSAGPKYLKVWLASLPRFGELFGAAAYELAEGAAHRRREGVEELVEVDLGRGRAETESLAVVERRAAVRPRADRDVVVGDAGERGRANHRGRALVQLLVDADFDLGQVVVGEADAFDRADRLAADQHLVVGHELGGVLEDELVLVAAAAAEEDDGEGDDDDRQARQGRNPRGGDPRACAGLFSSPKELAATDRRLRFPRLHTGRNKPPNRIRATSRHACGPAWLNSKSTRCIGRRPARR